jgi:hypothetical protein
LAAKYQGNPDCCLPLHLLLFTTINNEILGDGHDCSLGRNRIHEGRCPSEKATRVFGWTRGEFKAKDKGQVTIYVFGVRSPKAGGG